jgi:thiol-disulfide isomerase/thioredoxin
MIRSLFFALTILTLVGCQTAESPQAATTDSTKPSAPKAGTWRFVLESPGGPLPFKVVLSQDGENWSATAHNAGEVVPFDTVEVVADGTLLMAIEHYESVFRGMISGDGTQLEGMWSKVVHAERTANLTFKAFHDQTERFEAKPDAGEAANFGGRWAVQFLHDPQSPNQAIGEFQQSGNYVAGTFLTATGDYRFLEGRIDGNQMRLSCFDGGHAFLFHATMDAEGALSGEFWSSDKWYETWTAVRDEDASLPDPYHMSALTNEEGLFRFSFPDEEGNTRAHDDPAWADKVRIVTIFGSWCPNCNDEAPFLQELQNTYGAQGLQVIGLAFEATGNEARDWRVLKRFKKRHNLDYPVLLAGNRDKADATTRLPDLQKVIAYPTAIFLDRQGKVRHIHTGFTGPGTGERYERLKRKYHEMIREMLAETT